VTPEQATHRAMLADMPLEEIAAYLREQGWLVMRSILGYPVLWECLPAAQDDDTPEALPFDREGR